MAEMDNPFVAFTFIAGPAVLTNACAILQNSATIRYGLAIPQWREFRAALVNNSGLLAALYIDPDLALALAERRIRLLLRGLDLLYVAVGIFGFTCLVGLASAALSMQALYVLPIWIVVVAGGAGLTAFIAAMALFTAESHCARSLLRLQLRLQEAGIA